MPVLVIRDVPVTLLRRLAARADLEGVSVSELVVAALGRAMERSTRTELLARLEEAEPLVTAESGAEAVRAERERR